MSYLMAYVTGLHIDLVLLVSRFDSFPVMVYLPVLITAKVVNVCVKKNFHERKEQIKDKPDIHHLDVRGLGEVVGHVDNHGGQDQHAGEVHSHHSFKEDGFEEVCCMAYQVQEVSWEINSQKDTQ